MPEFGTALLSIFNFVDIYNGNFGAFLIIFGSKHIYLFCLLWNYYLLGSDCLTVASLLYMAIVSLEKLMGDTIRG